MRLIVFFLIISARLYSQTIINAESVDEDKDSSVYALALMYSGTRGNTNTNQVAISPVVILKKRKNEFKVFGGYDVLTSDQSHILNSGYAHVRHNYAVTKVLKTLLFYQLQFNEVLALKKREVIGSGLRVSLVSKDSVLVVSSFGIMHELELLSRNNLQLNEVYKTNYFRGSFIGSFKWNFNKHIQVTDVIYYQPWLKDFSDYRALNDFNLSIKLSEFLNFLVTSSFRFDSQPPTSIGYYDWNFMVGINVKL